MILELGRTYSLQQKVPANGGYYEEGAKVKLEAYNTELNHALVVTSDDYQFETAISNLQLVADRKPAHYDTGIDTIAFLRANCPPEQVEGFLRGNALKYLQRYDKKNGVEDLRKAKHYIEMLIEEVEEK